MIPDAFPLPVREPNHSTFIADRTAAGNFEIGSSLDRGNPVIFIPSNSCVGITQC
jgi:hypothetical protein